MKPNLALTPPMGWNSWNSFGEHITEADVRASADALVATGLAAAGYHYVVIDDHWHGEARVDGKLTWNTQKFPSGIPALADYVHRQGLKFGIYSCAGTHTCGGKPASFRQEEIDARTFAEWGVDFLKYDFCFFPAEANGPASYRRMAQALRNCGRDIVFSLCNWGRDDLHTWARHSGGHLWRTAGDIQDKWSSIHDLGFRRQKNLHPYAGPGGWNDPDMLVVGMRGQGNGKLLFRGNVSACRIMPIAASPNWFRVRIVVSSLAFTTAPAFPATDAKSCASTRSDWFRVQVPCTHGAAICLRPSTLRSGSESPWP